MRPLLPALLLAAACAAPRPSAPARDAARPATFANPLDLDYRLMPDSGPSWRQAADPIVVPWGDEYLLLASQSGGYWRTRDFRRFALVVPTGLPLEQPAPALLSLGGRLYYTAHKLRAMYATDDPLGGRWERVADMESSADPMLFRDDDGRVYLYHGSALDGAISGVELDPARGWRPVGASRALLRANHADHGWERSGPDNLGATMAEGFRIAPYVEGAWMTKHDGTYYLQYAAPGTVWKTYADGVYTARSPLGPFAYAPYSPFSYRVGGFVGGAGHSAMFQDRAGNHWRVTTMIVSVTHKFERRLGLFPAGFDRDGVLRTNTYLGDLPQLAPGVSRAATGGSPLDSNHAGWMLLSAGKPAAASSTLDGAHGPALAFDEDVRTQWSARTGGAGEWLRVDLGREARVDAVQVNFGEQGATAHGRAYGRDAGPHQRYVVEGSLDGARWRTLVDRSASDADAPHAYHQLDRPARARHVRVTNVHAAAGARFAVRDLRVFGEAPVPLPGEVAGLAVRRDPDDDRAATLRWERSAGARSYVVRFGVAPEKLYGSWEVGDTTALTMRGLNRGVPYWFVVDAVNERGVARGRVARRG